MAKTDRDNTTAWIGNKNSNIVFSCSKNSKTLTVTFLDGSTVNFTGS